MSNSTRTHDDGFFKFMSHEDDGEASKTVFQRPIYWDLNKVLIMVITMLILVMGVTGNVTVLLTISIRRMMHTPLSCYILNLAVLHAMLSLIACPFLTFQILRDVQYGPETCAAFFIIFYGLAVLLSSSILTIGLDRLWKTRWSWYYLSHHSCRLAVIVVAVCWLLGIVLAICLEVLGQDRRPLRDHMCQTSTTPATTPDEIVLEVVFLLSYIITLASLLYVLISYGYKRRRFKNHPHDVGGDMLLEVPAKDKPRGKDAVEELNVSRIAERRLQEINPSTFEDGFQEARAVRMFWMVFFVHTVSWLPFYVVFTITVHWPPGTLHYHIIEMAHYLALFGSVLYPVIFYFFSVEFNILIRQILRTMCCCTSRLQSGSLLALHMEQHEETIFKTGHGSASSIPRSLGLQSEMSVDIKPHMQEVATSASAGTIGDVSVLMEVEETDGPSSQLEDWKKMGPKKKRRRRRRKSDITNLETQESKLDELQPDVSKKLSSTGSGSSRVGLGSSLRGSSPQERVLSPREASSRSHWGRESPPSGTADDQQRAGTSGSGRRTESAGHRFVASIKNLFHRGPHDSRSATPVASGEGSSHDSVSGGKRRKRPLMARLAAALGPSNSAERDRQRTDSEKSLVRKLVRSGLPSGVRIQPGEEKLAGVWRSPSGEARKVDPDAEDYPRILQRMVEDADYQSPTGKRIHHVCAAHHVHKGCHHHDWRRAATGAAAPRQQTSINTWTGEQANVTVKPVSDRAAEQLGPLMSFAEVEVAGNGLPGQSVTQRDSVDSTNEDFDQVKTVHMM